MSADKTKIAYLNESDIQDRLTRGIIDGNDMIITKEGGIKFVKPDTGTIMDIGGNVNSIGNDTINNLFS